MSDNALRKLLIDAKEGEEAAMLTLIDKYRGMIKLNAIYNGEINEDLEQDIICKVIEAIYDFNL